MQIELSSPKRCASVVKCFFTQKLKDGLCIHFLGLPWQSTTGETAYTKVYFHSTGGSKSKIKVLVVLASPEVRFGLQTAAFSLRPHVVFSVCVLIPSSWQYPILTGWGQHPWPPCNSVTSWKALSYNKGTSGILSIRNSEDSGRVHFNP